MKFLLILLAILLMASAANAQQVIVLQPQPSYGTIQPMVPVYIDPQYGIDTRTFVSQPPPAPIVIYDPIVPAGRSQRIYQLDPVGPGTWMQRRLIVGDDD